MTPAHWVPPTAGPSTYQASAFPQSILQRTTPSTSYPTPPPGITTSSSSLAFALGKPVTRSTPNVYRPEEPTQFFNNFLEQKSRQMDPSRATTPPSRKEQVPLESPDPLTLAPSSSTAFSVYAVTPRKRKPEIQAESPSLKRVQSTSMFVTPHKSFSQQTPSSTQTSTTATATSKSSQKLQPYIEVPPLPKSWFTPLRSASQKSVTSLSRKMQGKMKVDDMLDDLGGYGSVDDDDYSTKRYGNSSIKSSARRTGDRDDRGIVLSDRIECHLLMSDCNSSPRKADCPT